MAILAACSDAPQPGASTGLLPAPPPPAKGCGDDGYLETSLYGAIEADIDWYEDTLDCEGMRRPDNAGARLRFAGLVGEKRLAIIIAIPSLVPNEREVEMPSNVTIIEEGSGRFFSTAGNEICWTDIVDEEPVDDGSNVHLVTGNLYCISPIFEVNGASSVSVDELDFSGIVDWGDR